jgi:hypothetical protein
MGKLRKSILLHSQIKLKDSCPPIDLADESTIILFLPYLNKTVIGDRIAIANVFVNEYKTVKSHSEKVGPKISLYPITQHVQRGGF